MAKSFMTRRKISLHFQSQSLHYSLLDFQSGGIVAVQGAVWIRAHIHLIPFPYTSQLTPNWVGYIFLACFSIYNFFYPLPSFLFSLLSLAIVLFKFRCSSCSVITRFPRYNDPLKVFST